MLNATATSACGVPWALHLLPVRPKQVAHFFLIMAKTKPYFLKEITKTLYLTKVFIDSDLMGALNCFYSLISVTVLQHCLILLQLYPCYSVVNVSSVITDLL